jgi:small subunit ribosomal protein S18
MPRPRRPKPKYCQFCKQNVEYIDYKDLATLKSYLNERGKIKARRTSGACPQHQRVLAEAVKNAREMALIPYSVR